MSTKTKTKIPSTDPSIISGNCVAALNRPAHTPSPWKVWPNEGARGNQTVIKHFDDNGFSPNWRNICLLPCNDGNDDGRANAALISSAPDLLAALQRLVAWADCGCDPSETALENARASIARATGKDL